MARVKWGKDTAVTALVGVGPWLPLTARSSPPPPPTPGLCGGGGGEASALREAVRAGGSVRARACGVNTRMRARLCQRICVHTLLLMYRGMLV